MKKSLALAALTLALCSNLSCEQQSWEQTKMFNQNRHAPGHGASHGDHGTSHSNTPGTQAGSTPGHGAKPDAAH